MWSFVGRIASFTVFMCAIEFVQASYAKIRTAASVAQSRIIQDSEFISQGLDNSYVVRIAKITVYIHPYTIAPISKNTTYTPNAGTLETSQINW